MTTILAEVVETTVPAANARDYGPLRREVDKLIQAWLADKAEGSRTTYRCTLRLFTEFVATLPDLVDSLTLFVERVDDAPEKAQVARQLAGGLVEAHDAAAYPATADVTGAIAFFLSLGPAAGHDLGRLFRLVRELEGLKPRVVRRELSTLRSLVREAHRRGLSWTFDPKLPRLSNDNQTKRPGPERARLLQASLDAATDPYAARDRIICQLLLDHGMRRGSLVDIEFPEHVVLDDGDPHMMVLVKRKDERVRVPLTRTHVELLRAYLDERGSDPGPLFFAGAGRRGMTDRGLGGRGIYEVVRRRGLGAEGVGHLHPHQLRHECLSAHADRGEPVHILQQVGGHKSPATALGYVRAAEDRRRELAEQLAKERSETPTP